MGSKAVEVMPYDESWRQNFEEICCELKTALGKLALRIEHVGSTSVKGLSAKPVIDIDVVIKDYTVFGEVIKALENHGYYYEGDLGIPEREAFGYVGREHLMKHHLYVCPENSRELKRHLLFRDHLRSHPEDAAEYSRIKEEGAALYPEDMDSYIKHKSPFIEKIYKEIGI